MYQYCWLEFSLNSNDSSRPTFKALKKLTVSKGIFLILLFYFDCPVFLSVSTVETFLMREIHEVQSS